MRSRLDRRCTPVPTSGLPPSTSRPLLSALLLACFSLVCLLVLHQDLARELAFPPGPDQDVYLRAASDCRDRFALNPKIPLYSAWLGAFCSLGGSDRRLCFFREKLGSLFLLSVLCTYLGTCVFGTRTGILFGFWILNSKYIIIEPNGSNALATSLFVASLLCLLLLNRPARVPAGVLFLFLSSLARPEMRVPLFAVLSYLAVRWAMGRASQGHLKTWPLPVSLKHWGAVAVIALGAQALVTAHLGRDETAFSVDNAFVLGVGVTYIERYALSARFPEPWPAAGEVVAEIMPGVSNLQEALLHHPRLYAEHMLYNLGKSMRVLPAVLFGFQSRPLQLIAVLAFLASRALPGRRSGDESRWRTLPSDQAVAVVVWLASACLLVPMACVFLVLWRYYLPLVPVGMVGLLVMLQQGWVRARRIVAKTPMEKPS